MKPLYFALIIFFIIIIVLGIIFLFFRGEEEITGIPEFPQGAETTKEMPVVPPASLEGIKEKGAEELPIYALIQIANEPVSGFKPLKDGKVRFIEKSTGHVFEANLLDGLKELISNTTLPKIFDVSFSDDGKKALLRYLEDEDIKMVSAEFAATSTKGFILPKNILSFGYVPDSDNIFYFLPTGKNEEKGTVVRANYKNQSQREIYSSPFTDFIVSWPKSDILSLATRPSGLSAGFLYQYNPLTGSFKKILGDIPGLEVKWDKKGEKIAFSSYNSANSGPVLGFYNIKKEEFLNQIFTGLSQKCVFSRLDSDLAYCALSENPSSALYPDEWHQGLVDLSDEFWRINLKTGETKLIYSQRNFDVWDIEIAPNEDFLYFKDREQEFLWAIKIK